MSVKKNMSAADDEVYSERTIKREPVTTECEDQCSYSLIKVEKDSEDDTETVSILVGDDCIKQEEPEEQTTVLNAEQIVVKQESSDTDVTVKVEIEIGPTVIQPQYIGSSLHTTDASKAELIQCGGADVALGTTTPGATSHCGHSTGSRSLVHAGTTEQTKMEAGILTGNKLSALVAQKPLSCDIKSSTMRNMRIHTVDKPFSCNICEYKCVDKSSLARHIMHIHTRERSFSCNICEYKCALKSTLVIHMRIHTGEKPFSCNICNYKCTVKSSLVVHMRTHTGETFSCNICEYKSVLKSNVVKHTLIHTGEKPFSCNICGYKCMFKSNLVKHSLIHTGEKAYSCNICEYKSVRNATLVRHMLTHKVTFSCNICDYKCKSKSHLVKHMLIHIGV